MATSGRSSLTRWITRSAAAMSAKVMITTLARDRPAASSVSFFDESPKDTASAAMLASRTRSGSRSRAMKDTPSASRKRARCWPVRP
jgi:hypothetical protein